MSKTTTMMATPKSVEKTAINPLSEIIRKMKRGDITKLSKKTSFSKSYVSRVINGTRYNVLILKAAAKLVSRRNG
jgi:hypothetical protein